MATSDGSHAEGIKKGGCFRTGAVGLVSDDQHLRYLGGTKTMIKVKGLTVQTEEVEFVLLTFTGVRRAVDRREHSSYKVPGLRPIREDEFLLSPSLKVDRLTARALRHEQSRRH